MRASSAALTALVLLGSPVARDPLWVYETRHGAISWFVLTSHNVLVGTDKHLFALDPETGKERWRREDLRGLRESEFSDIPFTKLGLVVVRDSLAPKYRVLEAIDLETGVTRWSLRGYTGGNMQANVVFPNHGIIVVVHDITGKGLRGLAAFDIATGALRWDRTDAFDRDVELSTTVGMQINQFMTPPIRSLAGNQPPIFDSDTTAILYWSGGSVVRLNLRDGSSIWTTPLPQPNNVLPSDGAAPILRTGGNLFVPFRRELAAIRESDGAMLWQTKSLRGTVSQMEMSTAGLVVRGGGRDGYLGTRFLDVLDPATGASRWPPQKEAPPMSEFQVRDDRLFVASKERLVAVDLTNGARTDLGPVKFREGEEATHLELRGPDFLVSSSQNLMRIDSTGSPKYQVYFESVGMGFWNIFALTLAANLQNNAARDNAQARANASGVPQTYTVVSSDLAAQRFKMSAATRDHRLIFTAVEVDGKKGPGLARVDKETGAVDGKLLMGERKIDYVYDEASSRAYYVKRSGSGIVRMNQIFAAEVVR